MKTNSYLYTHTFLSFVLGWKELITKMRKERKRGLESESESGSKVTDEDEN